MNLFKTAKIFFATALLFYSCGCQKDFDYEITNGVPDTTWLATIPDTAEVNQLKRSIKPVSFVDSTIYNNQNLEFTLRSGMLLSLPPGLTTTPGTITSGTLRIESVLLKKKGDFIRMGVHTREGNRMLSSLGAAYIRVTNNALPMQVIQSPVQIRYNSGIPAPYQTYIFNNNSGSAPVNWIFSTDTLNNVVSTAGYHIVNTTQFGWINPAGYADTGNSFTTVHVALPAHYTNKNTAAFLVYNDGLSVDIMHPDISLRRFVSLPVAAGTIVKLVIISKQAGNYFMGQSTVTTTDGVQNVAIEPTITSMNLMLQELENL